MIRVLIQAVRIAAFITFGSLGIAGPASAEMCLVAPPDLRSWWSGDADAADVYGGMHGTLSSGASVTPGFVRGTFSLDGIDDLVLTPSPGLASGTVEFWLYRTQIHDDVRLFSQTSGSPTQGGATRVNADGRVQVWTGSSWLSLSSLSAVAPMTWTHLALAYNGTTVTLFVNGAAAGNQPSRFDFTTAGLGIGAPFLLGHGHSFAGSIDEFTLFSRPLTAAEVHSIYAAGAGGKCRLLSAQAGSDQTVDESALVTLDGTGSQAHPGAPITAYHWTQAGGPTVSLDLSDPARPTFFAPTVPIGGATVTFQLTVSNMDATSNADTVDVHVVNVNNPPVSVAQSSASLVSEGSNVQLDGANSFDEDGESLSYLWQQISGSPVVLSDTQAANPTLVAPLVGPVGETLVFRLTVSDGGAQGVDQVAIAVENLNHPPTANAGSDRIADEATVVSLNGSGSQDPDGDALQFAWLQTDGPVVTLSDSGSATPTFLAPSVTSGGALIRFQLVATDVLGASGIADSVDILIRDLNDPPSCASARATLDRLWAPNHKMVQVGIVGVTDPNSNAVAVEILGVMQDEPVSGLGDGDTDPDAVLQGSTVLLRAERSGAGNGRVYHISFLAADDQGSKCTGNVTVTVPHSIKGPAPINDGSLFDSTAN